MKKILTVLLVAIIATTCIFAGSTKFPRKGEVSFGVDLGNITSLSLRHQTGKDWSTYGGAGLLVYPDLGFAGKLGIEYSLVNPTYFNREHKAWFYPTIGGEVQVGVLNFNSPSVWIAFLVPLAFNIQFREVPLEMAITAAPGVGLNFGSNRRWNNYAGFAFDAALTLRYRF